MLKNVMKSALYLLTMCLFFTSCRKESTYWEDNFVAPLAHGSLTLGNMFPDTTIKSNPDSSLKIAFQADLINYGIDSLLKIPDTTITTISTNTLIAKYGFTPGTLLFNSSSVTTYDFPNGIELTNAQIRSGKVKIDLTNTVRQPLAYHYKLLSAKKNNILLDTIFQIPKATYTGAGAGTLVSTGNLTCIIDLSGYMIDFTGTNHNVNNTINQYGDISISTLAQADTLYFNEGLVSKFTFTSIVPQYAQGYFGSQLVKVGPDTSSFTVFNTIQSGMLNLNSANMDLKIVNEFGVAMRATIGNLTALSTPNHTVQPLVAPGVINHPYNINGAINNGPNAPVTSSVKTISLNNSNSNIKDLIGILPNKFIYQLSTQLNPGGNQGGNNDFAYYGTGFKAVLSADIPLYFSANNLVLLDTSTLDLSGVSQFNNVNYGQLTLTATNSYPFSINLQGYLLDANKNVLDVLFASPNTVQAPPLDANLKVIAPLQSKLVAPFNKSKLNNLKNARYIAYTATFNTAAQPSQIRFYDYYKLDLLLTADVNYTIGK